VLSLEKQLPNKAEMDALLSDINQAGIGRGLQFELFRPGSVILRDYHAELPIAIRLSGRFHDLGGFVSDIANLSRIVMLDSLSLQAAKDAGGPLALEATARTYRYLDEEELAKARQARTSKGKK
jgi:type IV pilus assembly protein PilO